MSTNNKNIENSNANKIYGFFPEVSSYLCRVDIDSNWVKENVNTYKHLGFDHDKCHADLSTVVNHPTFHWTSPEMKNEFFKDIKSYFAA